MKFVCIFMAMYLPAQLFASVGTERPAADSGKLPGEYISRVSKIDVKHIAINLRFDWINRRATGDAVIRLTPLVATDSIALDAAFLSIHSVGVSNGAALAYSYDSSDKNDALKIKLDRSYRAGEELSVKIEYHTNWVNETDPNNIWGSNGKGIRFFEPSSTEPKRKKQIWTYGEPDGNRYWFPCNDVPDDLRTTEFFATLANELTVVSNGELVATENHADGTHTFQWKMDQPYPNYQTAFVAGQFTNVKQQFGNIRLHSFGYRDEKDATAASVERLPDMIKYFSTVTGMPYQHSSYSQVFVQELPAWAGNSSFSTITENMIDDARTHADYFYLWDLTEAEALASQWFGNNIYCKSWEDIWLNKSFAHYFAELYDEYKNGRDEFLMYPYLTFDQATYFSDWNAGIRQPVVTKHFENVSTYVAGNYPYFYGAAVLHMLRKQIGDAAWWKAVKLYLQTNKGKLAGTNDFISAVEKATGKSMRWFFDQWVYKMGHPVFEVSKSYDHSKKQLVLIVKQVQKSDNSYAYPQTEFFKGKLEVGIDEKIVAVNLKPMYENKFYFSCRQQPKLVNFDVEGSWVKEINFEKSLEELLYQFQQDKDILGRNWAMTELVTVAKKEGTTETEKEKIFAAFRKVILGNAYWRLRSAAMLQLRSLLVKLGTPLQSDSATTAMLLFVIKNEKSWLRASAITFLGMTKDEKFADLFIGFLSDSSDRVINAAAIALGKTKSPKAFDALVKLKDKPSWKNQSLISALYGLKELADVRALDIALKALTDAASPHWTLALPVWDHRLAAAETLLAIGKADMGYPLMLEQFKKAMAENNLNDIFYNTQQIATLADPRGQEIFGLLKAKYKDDANAMNAVNQFEAQFAAAVKK